MEYLYYYVAEIIGTLLITLIGVLGAWLTTKIGKQKQLANIELAKNELIVAAQTTVGELQQTLVGDLKAAHSDGKLTQDEITALGKSLITMTKEKMSKPAFDLLAASAVDVNAMITGVGEDWISKLKMSE